MTEDSHWKEMQSTQDFWAEMGYRRAMRVVWDKYAAAHLAKDEVKKEIYYALWLEMKPTLDKLCKRRAESLKVLLADEEHNKDFEAAAERLKTGIAKARAARLAEEKE